LQKPKKHKMKKTNTVDIVYDCASVTYEEEIIRKLKATHLQNHLPGLHYDLYRQISSWLTHMSVKNDVEGVCSLTILDGEWVPIIWHQEADGPLHVKFDQQSEDNIALVELLGVTEALKKTHCTIHSHNKAAASQSGDDADDERSKNGWHLTIGDCNKAQRSLHCRFNVFENAKFENGVKVSPAHQEFVLVDAELIMQELNIPDEVPDFCIASPMTILMQNTTTKNSSFPEEWLDRCTKKKVYPKWNQHKNLAYGYEKKTPSQGKIASPMINTDTIEDTVTEDKELDLTNIDWANPFTDNYKAEDIFFICQFLYEECRYIDIYDVLIANDTVSYDQYYTYNDISDIISVAISQTDKYYSENEVYQPSNTTLSYIDIMDDLLSIVHEVKDVNAVDNKYLINELYLLNATKNTSL